MTATACPEVDLDAEVDRLFAQASLSDGEEPEIVLIRWGPAAGKTTLREARFSTGYVLIDGADIFLSLKGGAFFTSPTQGLSS